MVRFTCCDCEKEGDFKSLKVAHAAGWTGNPNTTESERCPECHEYLEDLDALARRQAESLKGR